jgi:hypothetical protein
LAPFLGSRVKKDDSIAIATGQVNDESQRMDRDDAAGEDVRATEQGLEALADGFVGRA